MSTLITGAGGFIGGHLAASLVSDGDDVLAVDVKPFEEWYQFSDGAVSIDCCDLRDREQAREVMDNDFDVVYNLAADMGGIGYIENNKAACMLSMLINTNLLLELKPETRYFFASSACVYAAAHQDTPDSLPLAEWMAYPAEPEDGYGWEKLFSERLCRHFAEDYGHITRVARFHNVYGPQGAYDGGREKAPAAICRKVAMSVLAGGHEIEIWGDGEQTRSFMWVGDCVEGAQLIANGHYEHPLNLGTDHLVSINELVGLVEEVAGVQLDRCYDTTAPQGVRGRNSDNTLIRHVYDWEPCTGLADGLEMTYRWIYDQLVAQYAG